jgi:hypothetical protein
MRVVENFFINTESIMPSKILYHESAKDNRESILRYGLSTRFSLLHEEGDDQLGLTFLTDVRPSSSESFDIWEVDVDGMSLEEDWTTDPPEGEKWYCTGSIPSEKIRLISAMQPSRISRPG